MKVCILAGLYDLKTQSGLQYIKLYCQASQHTWLLVTNGKFEWEALRNTALLL